MEIKNNTKQENPIESKILESAFCRTKLIFGSKAMEKLAASSVIVFGAGGVGGYVIEALARSGIGRLDIVDNDTINLFLCHLGKKLMKLKCIGSCSACFYYSVTNHILIGSD